MQRDELLVVTRYRIALVKSPSRILLVRLQQNKLKLVLCFVTSIQFVVQLQLYRRNLVLGRTSAAIHTNEESFAKTCRTPWERTVSRVESPKLNKTEYYIYCFPCYHYKCLGWYQVFLNLLLKHRTDKWKQPHNLLIVELKFQNLREEFKPESGFKPWTSVKCQTRDLEGQVSNPGQGSKFSLKIWNLNIAIYWINNNRNLTSD